ncbi:MAG: hypothetical protein ACI4SM_02200 [Candidatus Gastranaerophilaceae bacterium]
MGYAGIQTMLLTYKMQKSDKEFQLSELAHNISVATRNSNSLSEWYNTELSGLDKDDAGYEDSLNALDKEYKDQLAEIAAWEEELDQKKSNCETQISLLDGYINSSTSALQSNIQKAHTYGPQ